jgi:hypothetical protein
VKKHVALCKKAVTVQKKKDAEAKDKVSISEARTKAVSQAQEIRSSREKSAQTPLPLFAIESDAFTPVMLGAEADFTIPNGDEPLLFKSCDKLKSVIGGEVMQKVLCNFASSYKKTKGFLESKLHQSPFLTKQGKEEVDAFMQQLKIPTLDIAKVHATFASLSWMYGLATPFHTVEFAPSSAGMVRLQVFC